MPKNPFTYIPEKTIPAPESPESLGGSNYLEAGPANFSRLAPEEASELSSYGWTPEALEMVNRLVDSGLEQNLAMIAVQDMMGMNSKNKDPKAQWAQFQKEHPVRAHAKKLLTKGGQLAGDIASTAGRGLTKSFNPKAEIEREAAAKMLKDYIQSQELQRAQEGRKEQLWMMARMPGQPLFGQPVYSGPTSGQGVAPLPLPAETRRGATAQNADFARQANLAYLSKYGAK